jgi:GNAT superfamily N-acetyltransferase
MNTVSRNALIGVLQQALHGCGDVDAAWEGGSAAFGAEDALSDVDVVAVVADDAVASVFAAVEAALAALSPVSLCYHVPGTVGYAQSFYRLRDAGEFLVVDLVLIRRADPLLFREVELHGQGRTWFDRRGLLVACHLDAARDLEQARARVPVLAAAFSMFQHVVTKERLRGRAVEALVFYQAMTLRPLVEALRLLHCPQRRNFGLRYLRRDLPGMVCDRIESLAFERDPGDLQRRHDAAQRWFGLCIQRLQAQGPGAGLPHDAAPGAAEEDPTPIILRDPAVGDLGWMIHRQALLYTREHGWDQSFETLLAEIVGRFGRQLVAGRERCWVAERAGEVVGGVFVVREDEATAQLRMLYVEPSVRGQGLGRRLVEECLQFARTAGYRRMQLWTNDVLVQARQLYLATGFQLIEQAPHQSFGKALTGQVWARDL